MCEPYLSKEKIRLIIRALINKEWISKRKSISEKSRTIKKYSAEEIADNCGVSARIIQHIYDGGDACDVTFRELSMPLSRLICKTRFVDEKKEEGIKHAGS